MSQQADRNRQAAPEKQGRGWRFYLACGIALVALIVVFQNTDTTQVNFLFAQTEMPLIFALVIAILLGVAIGWLTPKVRHSNRRSRHEQDE